MALWTRYPGESLEALFGLGTGLVLALILTTLCRRVPRFRASAALVFGLLAGAGLDRFAQDIHQRGLDDRVLHAARRGDIVALRKALDDGGSPNADEPTSGGWPALSDAIEAGDGSCVELLLQRGARASYGNWADGSTLTVARKAKHPELISILRRYGALED